MMNILHRLLHFLKKIIQLIMGTYPMPVYHFIVQWGGSRTGFTEVSGLNIEHDVIEYREGSSPDQSSIKMPGLRKFANIVLKRGIVKGDTDFLKWINTIQHSKAERRDVTISLLNENHEPVLTWRVHNAWPVKYEGPALNSKNSEVAIESLELAHEGLSVVE